MTEATKKGTPGPGRGPVLVTGGAGFVGRHLVRGLRDRGHEVISFDVASDLLGSTDGDPGSTDGNSYRSVSGNLGDAMRLYEVLVDAEVTTMVHAGALADLDQSRANPVATVQANVLGTAHVLEASRRADVGRVVYISSEAVYGIIEGDVPVDEEAPLRPISVYGATKAAGELLLQSYRTGYGIEATSMRLAEVYGPGLRFAQPVRDMLRAALFGSPYVSATGSQQPVNLVYIDDVVAAIVAATETGRPLQEAYNVSDGREHTFGSIASAVRALLPAGEIRLGEGSGDSRLRQPPWDLTAIAADLEFVPRWPLEKALAVYADDLVGERAQPISRKES